MESSSQGVNRTGRMGRYNLTCCRNSPSTFLENSRNNFSLLDRGSDKPQTRQVPMLIVMLPTELGSSLKNKNLRYDLSDLVTSVFKTGSRYTAKPCIPYTFIFDVFVTTIGAFCFIEYFVVLTIKSRNASIVSAYFFLNYIVSPTMY